MDPPWNTVQFADLSAWSPATTDRSAWQSVLRRVGALVGRPGLAAFDEALSTGHSKALSAWAREYPDDPLAPGVWERITELAVAEARASVELERNRPQSAGRAAIHPAVPRIVAPEPPLAGSRAMPTAAEPPARTDTAHRSRHPGVASQRDSRRKSPWLIFLAFVPALVGGGVVAAQRGFPFVTLLLLYACGLALMCITYAWLAWWINALTRHQSLVFLGSMVAGATVAWAITMTPGFFGSIAITGTIAWVGSLPPLVALWLMTGRGRTRILAVAIGTIVAGSTFAVVSESFPGGFSLGYYRSTIFAGIGWQVGFVLGIIWLLLTRKEATTPVAGRDSGGEIASTRS